MPITKQQAQTLVTLAVDLRPRGAPKWDPAGIYAAIGHVRHLDHGEITRAVIAAASNPELKTPGAIANTDSEVWRVAQAPTPPPSPSGSGVRGNGCYICGKSRYDCERNPHADHAFETADQAEANAVPCPPEIKARIRALIGHRPVEQPARLGYLDETEQDPMFAYFDRHDDEESA